MKYTTAFIFILISISIFAQRQPYTVSSQMMSQGSGESIAFTEPNIDDRDVEKLWKDYSKDFKARAKGVRRSDEYISEAANIAEIAGTQDIDIYFLANEYGDDTKVTVWFIVDSNFVSLADNPAIQKGAESFLNIFQDRIDAWKIEERLDDEEDALKDIERDLKKLENKNERYHKNIEKAKEEIAENEQDIIQNEKEQALTEQRIEEQKARIQAVKEELEKARRKF